MEFYFATDLVMDFFHNTLRHPRYGQPALLCLVLSCLALFFISAKLSYRKDVGLSHLAWISRSKER